MSISIEVYPVMPTRPCRFCLCLQGGGVFADFDTNEAGLIFLRRISYDGYGCCGTDKSITTMSSEDSRILLDAISHDKLGGIQIEQILRRYFQENKDSIWSDALEEHELL